MERLKTLPDPTTGFQAPCQPLAQDASRIQAPGASGALPQGLAQPRAQARPEPGDPSRLQTQAPGRTLRQVLEGCPYFSRVSWSDYPGHGPRPPRARATGIFNLDSLVGKASQGRAFTARDRAALTKAGANLCYVIEYAFPEGCPQGERSLTAVMIVTMDWSETALLPDDALLTEIASGVAGEAVLRAALDAADYCWARTPSR